MKLSIPKLPVKTKKTKSTTLLRRKVSPFKRHFFGDSASKVTVNSSRNCSSIKNASRSASSNKSRRSSKKLRKVDKESTANSGINIDGTQKYKNCNTDTDKPSGRIKNMLLLESNKAKDSFSVIDHDSNKIESSHSIGPFNCLTMKYKENLVGRGDPYKAQIHTNSSNEFNSYGNHSKESKDISFNN